MPFDRGRGRIPTLNRSKARLTISAARTNEELATIVRLFREYAASLPIDLGYQGFEAELAALPGTYEPRRGELLLAHNLQGEAIGCVGLRPLDGLDFCEMKRLYVTPEGRGLGLGKTLALAIIEEARQRGYLEMRLDTLESMAPAIDLYESLGFVRIPPYYDTPVPNTLFMSLGLSGEKLNF